MNRVVVTGATSFLGRSIVNNLLEQGCEIYALIRPTSQYTGLFQNIPGVTTILAEMCDSEQWTPLIGSANKFVHLGWDGSGMRGRANNAIQEKNVSDTLCCLRGANALGCKTFLFTGSQAEYGLQYEIINEDTVCTPVTPYGKAKYEVFKQVSTLAEELGICYYHTRIFSVYGPEDHPYALIPDCIQRLKADSSIELSSCEQTWNYLYITDAAKMITQLLFSGASGGVYNVASLDTRKLKAFVLDIYQACGSKGDLRFGARISQEQPPNLWPDIRKILGVIPPFEFTPFAEAIRWMVEENTGLEGQQC